MLRATFLCLLCCLSFAVTQLAVSSSQPSTPIQIIYTLDGTTLSTYNIDPLTLQPTLAGTLTVEQSLYAWIYPSPHGHFLYFATSNGNQSSPQLFVYATDPSGAPQSPAVQKLNVNGFGGLQIDPSGHFLYMANYAPGSYQILYILRRYVVDLNTGKISQPLVEAKYVLPSFDADSCGLFLSGFNSAGTTMYDGVDCTTHEGPQSTYYERTLNPQTGALGPDTQVFAWALSNGYESVSFVKNLVFNFVVPDDWQQGVSSVNVYPLVPNTNTPLLQCTASMLEACGYGGLAGVHPSGEYVFMDIGSGVDQVEKVDLNSKTITDTSYYIPYAFGAFSPDGSLVYAVNNSGSGFDIEIYGFNVSTGAVTPGQYIYVPQQIDNWLAAQRY